jgi:hypothetical protein
MKFILMLTKSQSKLIFLNFVIQKIKMEEERRIPSLQYLCLKKIQEENPVGYKKFISRRQEIFDDLDRVLDMEMKMRKDVKETILAHTCADPNIYGPCVRDEILGIMPRTYHAYFSCNCDLNYCLSVLSRDYKIDTIYDYIGVWQMNTQTLDDQFRNVKLVISQDVDLYPGQEKSQYDKPHPISFILIFTSRTAITVMSEDSIMESIYNDLVFDVDQLMYRSNTGQMYHLPKVKMNKSLRDMEMQILRKEYKIYCRTDSFLEDPGSTTQECIWRHDTDVQNMKKELDDNGWTCINLPCTNPYCIMAPEDIAKAQEERDWMDICLQNFSLDQKWERNRIDEKDKVLMKYELPETASDPKLFWRKCYDKTRNATKIRKSKNLFYKVMKGAQHYVCIKK